jgi:hypothetical protein
MKEMQQCYAIAIKRENGTEFLAMNGSYDRRVLLDDESQAEVEAQRLAAAMRIGMDQLRTVRVTASYEWRDQ